jgi:hypothetical protein
VKAFGQHFGVLRRFWKISLFLALGLCVGCGGGSKGSSSAITVAISPTTASLALGGTAQFTASVANDTSGRGVTWSLSQGGVSCAPGCGTISPTITSSGAPTTYTAPTIALSLNGAGVTLTATSVVDSSASAAAAIVVAGTIAVSVSPAIATIALNGTQTFIGVAANDTTKDGLTWELTQNGTSCSPGCGTIKAGVSFTCPTGTTAPTGGFCSPNGGAAIYTAPSTAPTNSGTVLLVATDIAAPGESGYSTITIQSSVSVSLSKTVANVPVNGTSTFTATLANDTNNQGVKWTLSQNGASCSASACGSVSPTQTPSGTATTYTAPGSPTTVTLTATSVADTSQSAYAVIYVQAVSVTVAPLTEILYQNGTAQFTATVQNDVKENGVTWALSINGSSCSASTCGTVLPTTTPGGTATTYTAPSSISSVTNVTLTATSVTDPTKSATATISLYPQVGVTLSPTTASVALGGRAQFTPTVTNDPTDAGVAWSLTQGGKPCNPGCGTVSLPDTSNGVYTVYLAPTTMPSSSSVTITATSNAELTQTTSATITLTPSSGAVAKLSGNYTFLVSGYNSAGTVVAAGSFTADGAGNITGGVADINQAPGVTTAAPISGSYTVAADNTGSVTLTNLSSGTALATLQFALNGSGDQASVIESDSSGTRGWGRMVRQSAAPSTASLNGNYAFSVSGADAQGGRFVLAGRFHADGAGGISAGVLDSNDGGSVATEMPFTGSYSIASSGRGILTANTPDGAMHWAFYMAGPGRLMLVGTDPRFAVPASAGEAMAQSPGQSAGGFTAASLDGTSVIRLAGTASDGAGSKAEAGLVTFDGAGGLHYTIDRNDGGTIGELTGTGSYSADPNGRVTMWFSSFSTPVISYLAGPNQGVVLGTGAGASNGKLDAQSTGPFSNASLSGGYTIGTLAAPSRGSALQLGVVTSTGLGSLAGKAESFASGTMPTKMESFQTGYSVTSSGRGAVIGGSALYLISPSKGIVVDMTPGETAGTISRIEK